MAALATRTAGARNETAQLLKYIDSLGSGMPSDQQTKLAEEAQDLLRQLKSNESALNALKPTFEVRYVVVCDLALDARGLRVSRDTAAKAAGCTGKVYGTFKALAASLLALRGGGVSVRDLGIRLGVEQAVPAAADLLKDFKQQFGDDMYQGVPDDQFVACALYVACLELKIRAPKKELVVISKLKSAGFCQLAEQMRPFYKQQSGSNAGTPSSKRSHPATIRSGTGAPPSAKRKVPRDPVVNSIHGNAGDLDEEPSTSKGTTTNGVAVKEDFETFRDRTVREAFQQLKQDDKEKYQKLVDRFSARLPEIFPPATKKAKKQKKALGS